MERLEKLIYETLKKALREDFSKTIDVSEIDFDILKKAYFDLRLTPTLTVYGDRLSNIPIKEEYGDILPPDEVIMNIVRKYGLPLEMTRKVEAYNKIYVYVITAAIGINDKIIEKDMNRMGYFLGFRQPPQTVRGLTFQVLQFEPYSQMQEDETEEINKNNDFLYHWTPLYNLNGIIEKGLLPNNSNGIFSYPPRIYFIEGNEDISYVEKLGEQLCLTNNNPKNDGQYALLKIYLEGLEDVSFYYDSNTDSGVYTEQKIPNRNIQYVKTYNFYKN